MNPATNIIALHQPRRLAFGAGCPSRAVDDLRERQARRIFFVASKSARPQYDLMTSGLTASGAATFLWDQIAQEPTVKMFHQSLSAARDFRPDAVVGLGGGSVLDVAKLVAAMLGS